MTFEEAKKEYVRFMADDNGEETVEWECPNCGVIVGATACELDELFSGTPTEDDIKQYSTCLVCYHKEVKAERDAVRAKLDAVRARLIYANESRDKAQADYHAAHARANEAVRLLNKFKRNARRKKRQAPNWPVQQARHRVRNSYSLFRQVLYANSNLQTELQQARAELANYLRPLRVGDVVILDIPAADLKANPAKAHANLDIYIVTNTDAEEVEILKLGGGYGTWALAKWCVLINPASELRADAPKDFSQDVRKKLHALHKALSEARAHIAELEAEKANVQRLFCECGHTWAEHRLNVGCLHAWVEDNAFCNCDKEPTDAGKEGDRKPE